MQLQENIEKFDAAGLGLVLVTYDSPAMQSAFVNKHNISYPVLSDQDASTVKALGILNEEYSPGDGPYGIPHPGMFILDTNMQVKAKIFVDGYATRVGADAVLELAQQALGS